MRNDAGEGQRIRKAFQALAVICGGFVGSAPAMASATPAIHPDLEWFAVAMVELDIAERKATGDLIFASSAESAVPPNPCATVQEPTALCLCPPQPPWAICY